MKVKCNLQSPIRRNMAASLFGVAINLLNQIVLVPFYIIYWGNELYSDWIVISALMTIFSLSDVGLNNVIQNRFAIKYSEGNKEECSSLLNSNIAIISLTFLLFLILVLIYEFFFDISSQMSLHVLSRTEAGLIFLLLMIKVFIGMYSGVLNAIYRATHHADKAMFYDQFTFLVVVIITFLFVVFRISLVWLSFSICIPYIVTIVFKKYDSQKYFSHHLSIFEFNWPLIRKILIPSLSFMTFPIGNTMILQGFTLVVNKFFGADEVVLFNTTRTLCNFIKTMVGTIQTSVMPEYSIAYGNSDYLRMRTLHRKSVKLSLLYTFFMGVVLLLMGPLIYSVWTHEKVEFSFLLMLGFIISLLFESIWWSSSVTVMATNNHTKLGIVFTVFSSFALVLAICILYINQHLYLVTLPLIVMQILMAFVAVREGLKLTKDNFKYLFT